MLFILIQFISLIESATISQLLQSRVATVSSAIGSIPKNPNWNSPGSWTLFVPTDKAIAASKYLPEGSLGSVLINKSFDYKTEPHYQILKDVSSNTTFVYDNYTPGSTPNPEIHCRYGTGEGLTVEQIQADNGWLYIMDHAIEPPQVPSVTIAYHGTIAGRGTSMFLTAVEQVGLTTYMDSLKDYTLFIPEDKAFTNITLSSFTPTQLKAIIMYHLSPSVRYSTLMSPVPISSGLNGQSINLTSSGEGILINGKAKVLLADIMTTAGVIHLIDQVLVPSRFPSSVDVVVNSDNNNNGNITVNFSNPTASSSPKPSSKSNNGIKTISFGWSLFSFIVFLCCF